MNNTADVSGGKPIVVWSQSISVSGVNAIYPIVAYYDTHGRKRDVLFFYYFDDVNNCKALTQFRSELSEV
jgi:hypothetical protein